MSGIRGERYHRRLRRPRIQGGDPSKASAKVSFRLVDDQDPQKVVATFQDFVLANLPAGCTVEFIPQGASTALRVQHDHPYLARASKALGVE